jgi:cyclic pyranopterin phosphate synthase
MQDTFGRTVNYLRLSVTEACNFRCSYCAPNGHRHRSAPPLTLDEIKRIVRAAVSLGMVNLRLTGGEPLMRRDIIEIVRTVAETPGVRDVSLTTNGYRLAELAQGLRDAGLQRVNISLDTLQRDKFARIVGVDAFDTVWRGILAAEQANLAPLKLNVVLLRGLNDDEIDDFAQLTIERDWHVRFIELMPIAGVDALMRGRRRDPNSHCQSIAIDASAESRDFFQQHFIPAAEIVARLDALEPIGSPYGNGPARTYRLPHARGTLGFITPASQHFCSTCNRIRVTSQGIALPCLFSNYGVNLRARLGDSASAERALGKAIRAKPERHPLKEDFAVAAIAMASIGG